MSMSPPPLSPHQSPLASAPPVALVLTILILVMFFVGFFSIYFCRCFMDNVITTLHNRQSPNVAPVNPAPTGLNTSIIETFPTFAYSTVKDFRCDKYGLECAICLCEFQDDDIIRLVTVCCHVFHQDCIDLWFTSHRSCPVCRGNLDNIHGGESLDNCCSFTPVNVNGLVGGHAVESVEDNFNIVINIENEEREGEMQRDRPLSDQCGHGGLPGPSYERFSRSHSTGHSIVQSMAEEDKYTLRLPEHVKETITRRHNVTSSCTTFGEYSNDATKRGGSSRS